MTRVLDLDALAPPDLIVRFGGVDYPIPGEVPLPMVVRALRLREQALTTNPADNDGTAAVLDEAHQMVLALLRIRTPDVPDVSISAEGIWKIVDFMIGGDGTGEASETAASQISRPARPGARPAPADEVGVGEDEGPFESAPRSRARSSSSRRAAGGRRARGAA